MKHRAESLVRTLEKITSVYRNLCDLLVDESRHMIAVDVKALAEATQSKEAMLSALWSLEQDRIQQTHELAQILGIPESTETLLTIANLVQSPEKEILRASHESLQLLIEQTKSLNQENMRLAEESLERIELMKRNIIGAANLNQDGYNASGNKQSGPSQGGRLISQKA